MQYDFSEMHYLDKRYNYNIVVKPNSFNKNSGKEILQYAVGALLYMPASNDKVASRIIAGQAEPWKSIVLDLEDALGDDLVGFGQRAIVKTVTKLGDAIRNDKITIDQLPLIFVRVREPKQIKETLEMLGEYTQYISGFNIPKFVKTTCDEYIKQFVKVRDEVKSKYKTDLYIMPIIENKNTMYRQLRMDNLLYMNDKLRAIQDSVLNIRVGGADFCSVYGIRRSITDDIYDIGVVRSVLNDIMNVFGKSYIVSGPVWEYFENKDNPSDERWRVGLQHELYADRLNGFIGKTVIHPSQVLEVQSSLVVHREDYDDAMNIIGMNANLTGVKKGAAGNRMNEVKTHLNWARKTVGLAGVYGVRQD